MYDEQDYPRMDRTATATVDITVEWSNQDTMNNAIQLVAGMIYKDIKPRVEQKLADLLDDAVNKAIREVLEKEVQPVDRWGKPIGEKASIRDLLMREAEKWLQEPVDYQGRRRGTRSYGEILPRIHWLFQEALDGEKDYRGETKLKKMIIKAIRDIIGDVEAVINETVREKVAEWSGK